MVVKKERAFCFEGIFRQRDDKVKHMIHLGPASSWFGSHMGPLKDLRGDEAEMVNGFIFMPCGRAVIGGMT